MSNILYIEDNVDTAEAVKIILEMEGHQVSLAYSGKDGLMQLKKQHFDLVILDINLPDMSGKEVFGQIKGMDHTKYAFLSILPISSEEQKEFRQQGIADYIPKPFTKGDLISRIRQIIGNN